MPAPPALLTTTEVAQLLRVHPKHVYRLLKRGLPARRVGSEWRFDRAEVSAWSATGQRAGDAEAGAPDVAPRPASSAPPLLAANGDRVVLTFLRLLREAGTLLGLVAADRDSGLALLASGQVLATGSHAGGFPSHLGGERLARLHLVTREVGLVARGRIPDLRELARLRLASRPESAGVRRYLDDALAGAGLDARQLQAKAALCASHLEVVSRVARGDADVGLASRAWGEQMGLAFRPLAKEAYGLLVRAREMGHPAVVVACQVAQGSAFRSEVSAIPGYDVTGAGDVKYDGVA
ncbi:MAG TPA: helix-turn-helix transcriptional regulator [Myxococcaceae bacterium]|nr:helix-turn-helix transcriptional regulator [Myxococcaceae bacterium]